MQPKRLVGWQDAVRGHAASEVRASASVCLSSRSPRSAQAQDPPRRAPARAGRVNSDHEFGCACAVCVRDTATGTGPVPVTNGGTVVVPGPEYL